MILTDTTTVDTTAAAAAGADASATSVDPTLSSAAAPVMLDAATGKVVAAPVRFIDLPNQGDTPAAPGFFAGVAQHIHDAVVGELEALKTRFDLLAEMNARGNEALLTASKARDAAKAELESLKADVPNLISEAVANVIVPNTDTPVASVIALAEPHNPEAFATAEDEIAAIKARLHAIADEAKAITARLADLSPRNASVVESAAHSFKALLNQVL